MISPAQIKNKSFTVALRGYSKVEVDAYIEALVEQYSELYRAYGSLSKRNAALEAELTAIKADRGFAGRSETAAVSASESAQEGTGDPERLAREACDKVLCEFHEAVRIERERLALLRAQVASFKSKLFAEYQAHIKSLDRVAKVCDEPDWDMTPTEASNAVLLHLQEGLKKRREEIEEQKLDEEIALVIDQLIKSRKHSQDE